MKQKITVKIAEKDYTLNVQIENEGRIRTAIREINNEISSMRGTFGNVPLDEMLSMILLSEVTKLVELERKKEDDEDSLTGQLKALDDRLGEYLTGR